MADVEAGYLSSEAAREIYFIVHDPATLAVDTAGTEAARIAELETRVSDLEGAPETPLVEPGGSPQTRLGEPEGS
jgi:hypothetical protein